MNNVLIGVMIPFVGTTLGAACVFFMKKAIQDRLQKALLGFASGVMVAASVWSLIIPAIEMSEPMGKWSFLPASIGIVFGMACLLLIDRLVPECYLEGSCTEKNDTKDGRRSMLAFAVALHNIPEGMAVGVAFAGLLVGETHITLAGAVALSIGIAVQNFPEGAIISMPLKAQGMGKGKSFFYGMLSGAVEPVAAGLTIVFAEIVTPALPYLLAFAAGAMLYVVVEELVPEAAEGDALKIGTIGFGFGFLVMMMLDVALG